MHCVQLLAPVVEPVIEPAAHSMHDALYDTVEYVPIGHAVHALAPALLPVLAVVILTHYAQPATAADGGLCVPPPRCWRRPGARAL